MLSSTELYQIFDQSIYDYHLYDNIQAELKNPYPLGTINNLLYTKNWIDTVQWHLEDIIRKPHISCEEFIKIKRWIDKSNQERTDIVEMIDDYYINHFNTLKIERKENSRMNSESIAWLIDRMSILALKVYHMNEQTKRTDVSENHIKNCKQKLAILLEQKEDLGTCYDQLIEDIVLGIRYVKVYRQMKMYNDHSLNPQLYKNG
jgi:hypothetical protein